MYSWRVLLYFVVRSVALYKKYEMQSDSLQPEVCNAASN